MNCQVPTALHIQLAIGCLVPVGAVAAAPTPPINSRRYQQSNQRTCVFAKRYSQIYPNSHHTAAQCRRGIAASTQIAREVGEFWLNKEKKKEKRRLRRQKEREAKGATKNKEKANKEKVIKKTTKENTLEVNQV
ncbi:hypothetical protein N7488_009951 [Penicillium malachiteum]|nr:hypothetical protein N7488_009951 [Penicillium malachiteum]